MSLTIKFKSGPPEAETCRNETHDCRAILLNHYLSIRNFSTTLSQPLHPEDQIIQSMPDASPTKWHLAHTTWFFETFILCAFDYAYSVYDEAYDYLFNSYYYTHGNMHARPRRGLLSRPLLRDIHNYREAVDAAVTDLIEQAPEEAFMRFAPLIEIGLNHEQQHQELILTDIKHTLSCNPLLPAAYDPPTNGTGTDVADVTWTGFEGGVRKIGYEGEDFAFDNERPRHPCIVPDFRLADRTVTNGEYLAFMEEGGYESVNLWLSEGWTWTRENAVRHPLYWLKRDGEWLEFTLGGLQPLDPGRPLCHINFFEADAFASWTGKRLPTEEEWEAAASAHPVAGHFLDLPESSGSGTFPAPHPRPSPDSVHEPGSPHDLFGNVWEWTASAYRPYPGFKPLGGSLGEYNGKFMCNQFVLRGGSCATPQGHIRPSYRNFFPPDARWQFSGIRLAEDG